MLHMHHPAVPQYSRSHSHSHSYAYVRLLIASACLNAFLVFMELVACCAQFEALRFRPGMQYCTLANFYRAAFNVCIFLRLLLGRAGEKKNLKMFIQLYCVLR